jgi:hypothetical protein
MDNCTSWMKVILNFRISVDRHITGIFFGMKQPFMFIPKEAIARIAVNTMRRTFDIHVQLENDSVVEFSMIDGSEQNNVANWVEWNNINNKKVLISGNAAPNQ